MNLHSKLAPVKTEWHFLLLQSNTKDTSMATRFQIISGTHSFFFFFEKKFSEFTTQCSFVM